jgi:predicted phage terminase large subunit-like protein
LKIVDALKDVDPRLLESSEGRRLATKYDPLLFAALYLPHKLKAPGSDEITLNPFHVDICNYALSWTKPLGKPSSNRTCWIAPRMSGKSTWIFHILPLWAGAHGHKRYILSFSDTADQAQNWLANFKTEIANNELLRADYPEFVEHMKRGLVGKALMDNRNGVRMANGFIFQARGVDSSVLGANIDGLRPEVLLFDDVEPPESNYGPTELKKRLSTIRLSHFYLNTHAIVAFVGTTTMPGSIIDSMRKVGDLSNDYEGEPHLFRDSLDDSLKWVVDEKIVSHYYPAIITNEDGSEETLWPEMWDLKDFEDIRHTREFHLNMMNRPISGEDGYWSDNDITLNIAEYTKCILSVDPAVTTKRRSDYTAFVVLAKSKDGKVYVRHAEQVKGDSDAIREKTEIIGKEYGVGRILVETNQGGSLWKSVFKDVQYPVAYVNQRVKKEVRVAKAADLYKRGRVFHEKHLPALEEQMLAYPNVAHDDLVDALSTGVIALGQQGRGISATQIRYMEVA